MDKNTHSSKQVNWPVAKYNTLFSQPPSPALIYTVENREFSVKTQNSENANSDYRISDSDIVTTALNAPFLSIANANAPLLMPTMSPVKCPTSLIVAILLSRHSLSSRYPSALVFRILFPVLASLF